MRQFLVHEQHQIPLFAFISTNLVPQPILDSHFPACARSNITCHNYYLLIKMLVNKRVVLHRKRCKPDNHTRVSINGTHMSHSEEYKLFVLVDVDFVTEILSTIWNRIGLPFCSCYSHCMMTGIHPRKWLAYTTWTSSNSLRCKQTWHCLSTISGTDLCELKLIFVTCQHRTYFSNTRWDNSIQIGIAQQRRAVYVV